MSLGREKKNGYIGELREPAENVVPDCNQSLASLSRCRDGWPVCPCLGCFVRQSEVWLVWSLSWLTMASDSEKGYVRVDLDQSGQR